MRKRFLAMLLVFAMILSLFPTSTFAATGETTTDAENTVSVYFSASHDADYMVGEESGDILALQKLDVPYFDLENYGLQDFYFISENYGDGDGDGSLGGGNEFEGAQSHEGKVTMLHLLIYATELYWCGLGEDEIGQGYLYDEGIIGTEVLDVGGSAGSMVINYFWGMDMNLNYYVNYEYPLASAGWGATLDQILLEDGDVVTIGHFESWSFYADPTSVFNFIQAGEETVTTTAVQGTEVTMNAFRAGADFGGNYTTAHTPVTYQPDIYYVDIDNLNSGNVTEWDYLTTADENGQFTVETANMEPGEYLICMAGQFGQDYPDEICSAPGGIRLTVEEPVVEVETYPAAFTGHTAQLNSFKVYTYEDGVKGETDFLEGVTDSDTSNTQLYATELPAGQYWLEGYDAAGDYNGGIVITVEEQEQNTFAVYRAYGIYASNSGWVLGTDYELSAEVTNQDKTVNRQAEFGSANMYGTVRPSCLCLSGDTVKIIYRPIGDKAEGYMETFKSKTMTINDSSWSQAIPQIADVTFVAPAGSVVSAGKFHTYYVYDFNEAYETGDYHDLTEDTSDDETDTRIYYKFKVPVERVNAVNGPNFFYRVQNEQGVTYWDFFDPSVVSGSEVEITEEELFIGSEEFNSETIYHNFEKNTYDRADIYLNVNGQGYMDLEVGEKFELNVFRNWMAIENFYNRKVALPDMEYQVIDMEGNPSDLLTITPDENNSSVADITANGEGTAVVLVTYDAMFSTASYVSGTPNQSNQYSAIWPENTAVLVVSVGADGTAIETNMTMNRFGSTGNLDVEHDTLFYVGDKGAEYTFTPEEGCTVTVNRSVVTDVMTFEGLTDEGVIVDENGAVTITGLTTGRHIIKVEKDGLADYQVITAREVSYELQDAEGNALAEDAEIKAGDTVYIQFTGLINPCEKLSGVYNHNARIYYVGEEGTEYTSSAGGAFGVYDFSGNPERQRIGITIPKYWSELSYSLEGAIKMNLSGSVPGKHRGTTYAKGLNANFNAGTGIGSVLSSLPEITINLVETDFLTGTVTFQDLDGNTINRNDLTITMEDAEGNGVVVAEDGTFKCVAGEYNYIINSPVVQYTTGSVTVTEDGENKFAVTLTAASEGAWDGQTETEPETDENGVYLITNGSEMAWFAAQSQSSGNVAVSGKLMNDIDLSWYPWNYNATSGSKATILDGDGHEIINLSTGKALFGTIGYGSSIRNLTIRGEINSTNGSSGAIVGYSMGSGSNKSVIENCVNYVNISGVGTTLGGLVGYASNTIIRNCVNYGDITTTGNAAGGIMGSAMSGAEIRECYNVGTITGTNYVGGIIGNDGSYGMVIDSCYNTGVITGTSYVGGVAGQFKGATSSWSGGASSMSDCYNVGQVNGESNVGGLLGNLEVATLTNGFYLDTTAESDPAAEALTEEEMKSANLNVETFASTCGGYPALKWQTDVKFHKVPEEGVVIAPTCTEKGHTEYVCPECQETFATDYTDALGHDWCEDNKVNDNSETENIEGTGNESNVVGAACTDCVYTAPTCTEKGSIVRNCRRDNCEELKTEEIPATGHTEDESQTVAGDLYKDCVCAVCNEAYRVWYDERLQYVNLIGDGISTITMSDEGNYGWIYDEESARFESSNVGVNGSSSTSSITVTLTDTGKVSFNYGVSSEANYDKLTIKAFAGDAELATIANAISGTSESVFEYELPAGTYTLKFTFTKDGSSASGSDLGWVSNLTIETAEAECAHETELVGAVEATCTEDGYTGDEVCTICGETITTGTVVTAAGHTEVIDEAVEATCTETGLTEGKHCSVCNEVLVEQTVVDALGHTEVVDEAVEATCTEGGLTEGKHCSVCNEVLVEQTVVDALGHTEVVDETVEATCTEAGLTEGKHCSVCNEVLVEQTVVDALGHTEVVDEAVEATCTETGLTEGKHCSVCNEVLVEQEVVDALGHTWGDWTVVKEATEEEEGIEERVCTTCGEKEERLIEKLPVVEPTPTPEPKNPFKDVTETDWFYKAVLWGTGEDIVAGWTEEMFAPAMNCTRSQIVTFLWRAAGRPEAATTECPFTDVDSSEYYYKAMLWAVEKGIAKGYTDTLFAPDQTCTRAEMATFLWRVAGRTPAEGENPFSDIKEGEWYYNAVIWAAENKVVSGYKDGTFAPENTIARAETVAMLYRYYNK